MGATAFSSAHVVGFLYIIAVFKIVDSGDEIPDVYVPPSNVVFPYGDPIPFAFSILESDTNQVHCTDSSEVMSQKTSVCPFPDPEPTNVITPKILPMSYPSNYKEPTDYIIDTMTFLKKYEWLYNYSNTHILVNNIFNHFPSDWQEYFKKLPYHRLNEIPLGKFEEETPQTIKEFFEKLNELKPEFTQGENLNCEYKLLHNSGLSQKKIHEIFRLAPLVDQICKENNLDFVVDIGAGLGYLSHLLNMKYDYSVLGIDCNPKYVKQAYENQDKHYSKSKPFVKFSEHFINENSAETIQEILSKHFPNSKNCCLTGLHACADLSITILDLFDKMDCAKCLVIMPCCYHRIKVDKEDENTETFANFPASQIFQKIYSEFQGQIFLRRPFLRLACQESEQNFMGMTQEEHERSSRNLFNRAILQAVAEEENCQVARLKRKSGQSSKSLLVTSSQDEDEQFHNYLSNLKTTHVLLNKTDGADGQKNIDSEDLKNKMFDKFKEQRKNFYLCEVLMGLQAGLQKLCENLVLIDRVEFLKERGYDCSVRKVVADVISPRCFALIAAKK